MISWFRESVLGLVDFLYPSGCVGCNLIGEGYLCRACLNKVAFIEKPFCRNCGVPIPESGRNYCPKCAFEFGYHDGGVSIALYDEPLSLLIQDLKYNGEKGIAKFLAGIAVSRLPVLDEFDDLRCDAVHPVPLFPKRKLSRGYNQSALIGKCLAESMQIDYTDDILMRVKDTKSQTGLTHDERIVNMKNAFVVRDESMIKGKSILLVDDVMTTGATIQECARVLKEAGVSKVKFLTIARQLLED